MEAKVEQPPATNANPVLSVNKDGSVFYSNEAGNLLLKEWGVKVGEKLPSHIGDIVQKVIFRNSAEKIEVKIGNRIHLVVYSPLPEQELVIISGFDISEQKEIEEHLLEAYEKIETQSEELSVSKRDLRVQSDELNYANTLLYDSVIGLRTLAENSPDFITRFDRQDRCIYANPAAKLSYIPLIEEFYGWSVHEFIDKTNSKVEINPEMMKLSEKLRKNAFNTGKSEAMVFHYTSPKGKKYWFDTKVIPEFANNEVVSILVISSDITDLKETEATLKSSNLYNRSLIEASLDPLVVIGNDGNVTDVNKATEQATGYSRNDLIGTYFAQYLTEPDHAISAFINVCTHGELRDCALEIKHRDGHVTPVLCNASVYRDENGKVIGVFVAARDITERKKAEKALKKAHDSLEERVKERTEELEKTYKSLIESEKSLSEAQKMAHIGNWILDIKTDKAYWSEELYRIFRRDPKELAPSFNEYLSYIHPEDRHHVYNALHKALTEKSSLSIDFRIKLAEGEERTVHMLSEIVFDEENYPVRIKGIVQDITERKKAEEKIKNLANIVESSEDAIGTISLEGIITSWNKGAEKVYGYSTEEILGKHVSILSPSHLEKETMKLIELIKQGECYHQYESLRIGKNGNKIFVSITYSPVLDNNGNLTAVSIIGRDITERKKAEETLAKIEIARKQEIHHRIKNNLQIISSLLDLQAEHFRNRECIKRSEILEAFRESQDRVISMALIHEELHKGGEIDTLNFSHYIEELAENLLLTYGLGNEGTSLNLDIEKDIFFDMDISVPLGMIINELISNSLKYAFFGRDKGEIQIKLHRKEIEECRIKGNIIASYILSVSDNGIGIPKDLEIENLDSLGLQLVISLVDQIDGELELKRDNGTEFNIKFTVTEKNNLEFEKPII